jgi:ribokinase
MLGRVDILTPNENEALKLIGLSGDGIARGDAPSIASRLQALGPKTVILKLGREGCFVKQPGSETHVAGFAVDVMDTTAAGDTFNAALAVALAEGQPVVEGARFANAAAAISVTRLGAQSSAPNRAEVDAFLAARPLV